MAVYALLDSVGRSRGGVLVSERNPIARNPIAKQRMRKERVWVWKETLQHQCVQCREWFDVEYNLAAYCSARCKQKAFRDRRKKECPTSASRS